MKESSLQRLSGNPPSLKPCIGDRKHPRKHALQADAIQMYNRQHTPLRPDAVCALP